MRSATSCLRLLAAAWLASASACGGSGSGSGSGPPPSASPVYLAPVAVSGSLSFAVLESSETHACGTTTDGQTFCWGKDGSGELGTSAPVNLCDLPDIELVPCASVPRPVGGVPALTAIGAAISRFTCGLAASGEAWCWGFGLGGQLGDGLRSSSPVPVAVAGGGHFSLLRTSALGDATCALSTTGEPWCWGPGGVLPGGGLLGDPGAPTPAPVPEPVSWGHAFTTFDLGEQHGCGLTSSGEAWCWGGNWYGQLGEGSAGATGGLARADRPVAVTGNHRFSQIAAGSDHTCALDLQGAASCWGAWDGLYAPAPVPVPGGHTFVSLAAGFLHTCALTSDGEAWCWGPNDVGQLGDGTGRASFVPVRVAVGVPLARLSHRPTCAVTAAGQAWCWGSNLYGQVGRASPFQR